MSRWGMGLFVQDGRTTYIVTPLSEMELRLAIKSRRLVEGKPSRRRAGFCGEQPSRSSHFRPSFRSRRWALNTSDYGRRLRGSSRSSLAGLCVAGFGLKIFRPCQSGDD